MKYLVNKEQLHELSRISKAFLVVFVDPNQFMPSKALLNYIHGHKVTQLASNLIFIWNKVDVEIYQRYSVTVFPQVTVFNNSQPVYSFIGYNREKANDALSRLCLQANLGKIVKKIKKTHEKCQCGSNLTLVKQNPNEQYINGCFECNMCKRLTHFDSKRPTLHCDGCKFDICSLCTYEQILVDQKQ